jgi:hypothetical protein
LSEAGWKAPRTARRPRDARLARAIPDPPFRLWSLGVIARALSIDRSW